MKKDNSVNLIENAYDSFNKKLEKKDNTSSNVLNHMFQTIDNIFYNVP